MQADKEKLINKESKISQQNHIIEEICENGEIQYNCTACRKTFRSRSQKYYHFNCNQLQNLIYKCEHCEKSFARHSQWKYHIESHLSPVNECHKCQKIFSNPFALKKHVTLHQVEPKLCPHCDKTFKKKISLDQHIAAQHLNQLQYGCAHCSKKYASKSSLQLHLQTHEKKRFECSFCGKRFQRNSILNLHLKRHNNTKNCMCPVCQKVFSESGALARHRKIHEENAVQYYCKLCDKTILRKDNMTRHLNTIHPEEKFDTIVEVIRPSITNSKEDCEDGDTKIFKEKPITITEKNVVIIENKLLHKPFELNESTINLPQNSVNITESFEQPLVNQIKVITAVPTYETKTITPKCIENTSRDETIKHQEQVNTKVLKNPKASHGNFASNCDLRQMQTEKSEIFQLDLSKTQNQTKLQTKVQESNKIQEFLQHHKTEKDFFITDNSARTQNQSFQICEPPKTQAISSVIRSIGNVKKNLTAHIVASAKKPVKQNCLEYKHKKYCRSNYNIGLYRKILGCDDDDDVDDNGEEDKELHQNDMNTQSEENLLKTSTTPVHWRKSFKNNYETSSS